MFDLTDRVAIVTGGAGLLGVEFCRTLAQAGASVVIADLDGEAAEHQAAIYRGDSLNAIGHQVDVSAKDSVQEMVEVALNRYGRVDVLVNSAAIDPKFDPGSKQSHSGAFEDYP